MRTGPFSDPVVVNVVNRYFVPVHLDNVDGSARRYGMEPGHENAYIIMEAPAQTVILGRLSQVLDAKAALEEMRRFLAKHFPEARPQDHATPEYLLEEGRAQEALSLLASGSLLRARALRVLERYADAARELDSLPASPEVEMERARLALDRGDRRSAAALLDLFLAKHGTASDAAEATYHRGWLLHLEGKDDDALRIWQEGIRWFPPETSLFSQKAHLTLIRSNWDLPANVDQEK